MATEKPTNFTAAQEAVIRAFSGTGTNGALTSADAATLAADPRMNTADNKPRSARSIIAKVGRMEGVTYQNKAPARKDGSPIESKAKLVEQIEKAAGVSFDALDKAARGDLVKLRDWATRKAA